MRETPEHFVAIHFTNPPKFDYQTHSVVEDHSRSYGKTRSMYRNRGHMCEKTALLVVIVGPLAVKTGTNRARSGSQPALSGTESSVFRPRLRHSRCVPMLLVRLRTP
jgi:hypothetical protein